MSGDPEKESISWDMRKRNHCGGERQIGVFVLNLE